MCIHICPFVLIDFKKSKQSNRLLTFSLNGIEFTTVASSYVFMENRIMFHYNENKSSLLWLEMIHNTFSSTSIILCNKKHNISPSFVTYRHTFATVEAYEKFRYAIRQPQTSYPSFPSDW